MKVKPKWFDVQEMLRNWSASLSWLWINVIIYFNIKKEKKNIWNEIISSEKESDEYLFAFSGMKHDSLRTSHSLIPFLPYLFQRVQIISMAGALDELFQLFKTMSSD